MKYFSSIYLMPAFIIRTFLSFVFLFLFGALLIRADTHYVSLQGTNDSANGYITWAGAATQIQWAVDTAGSSDTVLVSNGTFNLTNQITVSSAITLQSLYGTNDVALLTIINGGYPLYTNRCIKMTNATVDGFTITNGYFVSTPLVEGELGGAGVMLNTTGTLRNCIIQDNTCINTNVMGTYDGGGGVFAYHGGIITNCLIFRNTFLGPGHAGGVYLFASDSAQLLNSRIISNSAPSAYGGGAFGWQGTISNCDFYGNYAKYGGGLVPGTLTYGCRIYNNIANSSGGGIGGNGPGITVDCVISNNTVTNGAGGGVGIGYGCNFSNCVIVGNSASGAGGGIYAAAQEGETYRVRVANCTIYANKSVDGGGGVYCQYDGTFKNCLIYCNTNVGANGGGFYAYQMGYNWGGGPTGYIYNCTIVSNESGTLGGGIRLKGNNTNLVNDCIIYGNISTNDEYEDVSNEGSNSNEYYNCCTPVILAPNHGNITNDPLFVDQANRNYRLSADSPCINTGSNQDWMTNAIDADGNPRIVNVTVDIGAYEYTGGVAVQSVSPQGFTNAITYGQSCPSNTFEVWNSGGGTLDYTLATNASWLAVSPASGSSTGEHDTIAINYQTAVLSVGSYTGLVTVQSVSTSAVTVRLIVTAQSPSIIAQPQSRTNNPGQSATFSVQATGTTPLNYQWQKNSANISGATSTNYTIASVVETDEGNYRCIVTNEAGSATSSVASLTVNNPPDTPTGLNASDGDYTNKVALSWNAASGATGYQIFRHTINNSAGADQIGTATSTAYDDTGAVAGTTFYYWVKATNAAGVSAFSSSDSGWCRAVFTITATAGANGSITPSGAVPVLQGANQSFTILPAAGYYISSMLVDGVTVTAASTYTFENVSANHSLTAEFVVNRPPQLVLTTTPQSGVAPLRVLFDFTGSTDPDGVIAKYEVDRTGDGIFEVQSTEAGVGFYVEFAAAGTYQSVARVTDDCNATSTTSVTIQVYGVCPVAVIEAQPASGTAPLTVNFAGTNSTAPAGRQLVAYEWDFDGDGVYDRLTRNGLATWTYREAGTNQATLRITDNVGMKAENSALVVVAPSPFPSPIVTLSANPEAGYLPLTVSFTAQLANEQVSTNYYWDFDGDGQYDTRTSTGWCSNTYTVAGMYAARVMAMDANGLTGLGVVTVQVNQATTLRAWISTPKDNSCVSGTEVSLRAHAAPANLVASAQFRYKPAASNDWINIGDPIYPPPHSYALTWNVADLLPTNYHVRVAVTDTAGTVVYSDAIRVTVTASSGRQPGDTEEGNENGKHKKTETFSQDSSATLIVYDGTTVLVGLGTVDSNITINVILTGLNTNPVNGAVFGRTCINENRQVNIEGNPDLQKAVVIIIPYRDDDNDGVVDGTRVNVATLMMFWYDTETATWKRCLDTEVYPDEKYVKGTIYHLTEFGLFGGVCESPICGDIDGDGLADLITVVESNWYVWFSTSGYLVRCGPYDLGISGTPATGDIDGDGKSDLISVVGSDWYVWLSSSGYTQRIGPCNLGISGTPVTGDIDGDRLADLITVVGSNWYVWFSTSGYTQRIGPCDLGVAGTPATGDIDGGDGLADLVSVVDSNWYLWFSSSGYTQRIGPCNLGISGTPTTGDIDGDGLSDLISVVGSDWYVWFSTSGYLMRGGPYTLSAP